MKKCQAVIVKAARQAEQVDRLVQYCRDLDGTEIIVLDADDRSDTGEAAGKQERQALRSFHQAAEHFTGRSFCWLEPDSIPLKPHWLRYLSDEHRRGGKHFTLSSDSNPPHDLVGGIGIYGPESSWLIPKRIEPGRGGWDGWMLKNLDPIIHHTPLIQHSYGLYTNGLAQPHRFPRDRKMMRADALIFHRDRYQDLIGIPDTTPDNVLYTKQNRFLHSGDLGDIIAAMPSIRQLGGGQLVIAENHERPGVCPRESMSGARYEAIKPLLESGHYITSVEWSDNPEGITHDFSKFRGTGQRWNRVDNLAQWQARLFGITNLDMSPWLQLACGASTRVIAARSLRYHNAAFPWKLVANKFGDKLLFIGLQEEHAAFEGLLGRRVEWAPTPTLLDAAKHICSAQLGFYNQSAPFWIAAGLGKRLAQETLAQEPNSIVAYPGAWYSHTADGLAAITAGLQQK